MTDITIMWILAAALLVVAIGVDALFNWIERR